MAQYAYNPITNRMDLTNTSSPGGDVIGPGLSTDNALVRWDGITGTMIQNSNAILSDAGLLTLAVALPATSGGTGQSTYATGDVLYASAANTLSKLPVGSNAQVLTLAAGIPSWATPTTGTVTSVTGTTDRITSTGGATPQIDIAATYVGQASITTLGTITTGVWNGTDIALADGGTNASLVASNGGIFYSTATAGAILAGTATANQLLLSGSSTTPAWSTSTYPATNAINTLLYASSANTMAALATANSGVLTTSATGVPSIDTTNFAVLTTGVQMKGNNTNTAPPAGFIGERISASATAVATTSGASTTIVSISVTAGVWDVSGSWSSAPTGGVSVMQLSAAGISTVNNTLGANSGVDYNILNQATLGVCGGNVPMVRAILNATTTYYLVVQNTYTSTTCPSNALISATRVG